MKQFALETPDRAAVAAYRSLPDETPRGIVQIAHGMAEHFERYGQLTSRLNAAGYAVYGVDHRGHGRSTATFGLGSFGPGGFQRVVDDMAALTRIAKREQPGLGLALLGHSMGSFASQLYLLQHANELTALVLSGTAAMDELLGFLLASGDPVTLAVLNAGFEPARTGFDWLSRDETKVDAYIADPLCGFDLDEPSLQSVFGLSAEARFDDRLNRMRKDLPIYIISGQCDPVVGPDQAFVRALIRTYEGVGLSQIEHRIYPGGRHEMFNETCREQVEDELIAWLDRAPW
jgi:alpha-beta hydrolase superfamily lysophospholipase